MPKVGRFTSDKAKTAYFDLYDAEAALWPVPATDIDVETSFGITRVRKSGSGEGAPILLLPGLSGNGLFWSPFIEQLARDRVVYAPDIMGWPGRCEQTAPIEDGADVAQWLVEVFDGLGLDRVHLAGHSVGSWMAILVGVYHSDRLASVSMLEPGGATFAKPRAIVLYKSLVAGMLPTRKRMRKFSQWLTPGWELTDQQWAMTTAGMKFRWGMPWERPLTDDQLAAITAPMLILFGADTKANDPELGARRARGHIAGADIEIIPGVGHEMLWAMPEPVLARFLDFADTHEQVSA